MSTEVFVSPVIEAASTEFIAGLLLDAEQAARDAEATKKVAKSVLQDRLFDGEVIEVDGMRFQWKLQERTTVSHKQVAELALAEGSQKLVTKLKRILTDTERTSIWGSLKPKR